MSTQPIYRTSSDNQRSSTYIDVANQPGGKHGNLRNAARSGLGDREPSDHPGPDAIAINELYCLGILSNEILDKYAYQQGDLYPIGIKSGKCIGFYLKKIAPGVVTHAIIPCSDGNLDVVGKYPWDDLLIF